MRLRIAAVTAVTAKGQYTHGYTPPKARAPHAVDAIRRA
jgi:hypothetical protein